VPDENELRGALTKVLRELGGPVADGVEADEPSALLSTLTGLIEARELVDALHQIDNR
jgi:hypothetical protein